MFLLYEQNSSSEQSPSHKESSDFLKEYRKIIQELKEETGNKLFDDELNRLDGKVSNIDDDTKIKPTPRKKPKSVPNKPTPRNKEDPWNTNKEQKKSETVSYKVDFDRAMSWVDGFDVEVFLKWSKIIDQNTDIPSWSKDLMKAIIIPELSMSKESRIKRETLERFYVFDDVFDEERIKILNGWTYYPVMPWVWIWSLLWPVAKKLYQIKQRLRNNKKEYENATWPFQIKGVTCTTLICRSKELTEHAIRLLDNDPKLSLHPYKQLLKEYLMGKQSRSIDDQIKNIIHHPGCINLIQRLTYNNDLAMKVVYNDIKDNYAIWEWYAWWSGKSEDIRLTTWLSHLLWPKETYHAIAQQNLFLLGKKINIDMRSIGKSYMIDWKTPPNGQTDKLLGLIKNQLTRMGEQSRSSMTIKDLIKTPQATKEIFTKLFDTMSSKLWPSSFQPLLSVVLLQPLQLSKEIHLRYIHHYLKALQKIDLT